MILSPYELRYSYGYLLLVVIKTINSNTHFVLFIIHAPFKELSILFSVLDLYHILFRFFFQNNALMLFNIVFISILELILIQIGLTSCIQITYLHNAVVELCLSLHLHFQCPLIYSIILHTNVQL